MGTLKELLRGIEDEDESSGEEVEVLADSVRQALEIASGALKLDVSGLDYDILQKGTRGFLGVGRQPYRVLVRASKTHDAYSDVDEIERKLSKASPSDLSIRDVVKYSDGSFKIRVTKSGIYLIVNPPSGGGQPAGLGDVNNRLFAMRISNADMKKVEKEVGRPSGKRVKIGEWMPNAEYDGSMTVEISEDEMKTFVHFVPPRFFGRHMDLEDVVDSLKRAGVVVGINEEGIGQYLEKMEYSHPLLAAEGQPPRHGKDASVDYKVKIDKTSINLSEDERGQVDFKNLDILENVVVGQVLAVKIPAQEGIPGRTVTNRVLPARSGKDLPMRYGKGTILSEDGMELTAEINGQVVFQAGKIMVEPVFFVKGDVSFETGNIVFLGSVVVGGSVQDNFVVKAAGNIEVKGSVQKAFLEAEGDIIIRQGIMGREEAKIESTGGSIFANFVQSANCYAEKDIIVSEGILHSRADAGNRILCHGRRARIVGGVIRAGEEVNARIIGSDSFTRTEVRVGINPKVLQQVSDLEALKQQGGDELEKIRKDVTTLTVLKNNSGGRLPQEKEELLQKLTQQKQKLETRHAEVNLELEELKAYLGMLEQKGKVCAEQTVFPGVEIYIKDRRYPVKDPYNYIKFTLEGGEIRLSEYEKPDMGEGIGKMTMLRRRR
ncbi:MAG: DUF342 domain-containing protein [Spirochaetota bacterium]|jgi:uncharacterized protein (DUF342 family)